MVKMVSKINDNLNIDGFIKAPRWLIKNKTLTILDKLLYINLAEFVYNRHFTYPSIDFLCYKLSRKKRVIFYHLNKLEEKKLIKRIRLLRRNVYIIDTKKGELTNELIKECCSNNDTLFEICTKMLSLI